MKKALLILLPALVLGGVIGTLVIRDPGYVLVAYDSLTIETSLWFALLSLVLGYALLRLLLWLLFGLTRGTTGLREWNAHRRERNARDRSARGLLLLVEGNWPRARKLLEAAAKSSPLPALDYLGAARAAHHLDDAAGRERLLQSAAAAGSATALATALTRAGLLADARDWPGCLAALAALPGRDADNPQVLRLRLLCHRELQDWPALLALMPQLKKRAVLDPAELARLQHSAWEARLGSAASPIAVWEEMPRDLRREPALIMAQARALLALGHASEAARILGDGLNHEWNPRLLGLYGSARSEDPERQLAQAERWLKEHPDDPDLLLALGRISLANRLWSKAREYFEASLRHRRSAEVQGELGRLYAALGDRDRSNAHLLLALDTLPALPLPEGGISGVPEPEPGRSPAPGRA